MAEKKDRAKKQEKKPKAAKPKQITHSKDKDAYPVPSKKLPAPAIPKEDEEIDPKALERGDRPMSLVAHLDEFRSRFMRSLITILVIMLGSFFFSDYILSILTGPYLATGLKLNVFNLIDGFLLRLKASLITGILIAFPLIVYELWKYIAPADPGARKAGKAGRKGEGTGSAPAGELYDLGNDPGETTDLAPRHPERVREMGRLLEEIRANVK